MAGASPTADEQRLCDRLTVRADIKRHFRSHIVRQGEKFPDANHELSKHYIRAEDIQEAWSGIGTVNKALYPSVLAEHVAIIKDRFLILLSILVSLDAHAYLDQFGNYLSDGNGSMLRTNNQLPLKYDDIPNFGNPDLQERFFEEQYKFAPIVIYEASEPAVIENDKRLPFEAYSAEMSEGAFGQVQKVTISKQHFVTEAGVMASNTTVVALKRFPSRPGSLQDSKKELNNLEVLKKSITKHRYIRTHLAAFFYRSEHIILLPWADRYDLHLFLLEGHDQWEKKIYDFETVFGDPSQEDIVRDSYKQLVNIAAALKWLHEDVRPLNKHLYFAHMDLKPDNILIDNDDHDRSTVGKWVLTDFGISAFKESTEQEDDKYVSIRDYVERKNLTMDTSARRYEGAYQPPEMERRDQASGGPGNHYHRRRAGRRGDIWSFGCIFSEVIAFCAGRSEQVIAFRNARRENYGNDYFYQTLTGSSLGPGGSHVTHRLRPEMMEWLQSTSNKLSAPTVTNAVLLSSVDKISEILVIEGPAPEDPKRPRASQLLRIMDDLKGLFDKPFEKGQDCAAENLRQSAQPPLATGRKDAHTNTVNLPTIIVRSDTFSNAIKSAEKDNTVEVTSLQGTTTPEVDESSETQIPQIGRSSSSARTSHSLDSRHDGKTSTEKPVERALPSQSETMGPSQRSLQSPQSSITDSQRLDQGILGMAPSSRSVRQTVVYDGIQTPGTAVECVAICSSGRLIATITKPSYRLIKKKPIHTLRIYEVSIGNSIAIPLPSSQLPLAKSWNHVSVCADMVVTWGDGPKYVKQVFLVVRFSSIMWTSAEYPWLATLNTVILTKERCVVFVCHRAMYYVNWRLQDPSPQLLINAQNGHSFKHAAVDDDTGYLYMWSSETSIETLQIWRLGSAKEDLNIAFDSAQNYHARTNGGDFKATIFPFYGRKGCVVRLDGDDFVCSPSSLSRDTLALNPVRVGQRSKICVYNNSSLLYTEPSTKIRERLITQNDHEIRREPQPFKIAINASMDAIDSMRVVRMPNTEDLNIIVITKAGKIFFVPITA